LIAGLKPFEPIGGWHADGRSLYVLGHGESDAYSTIFRVSVATGERTIWKELAVPDPVGLGGCQTLSVTPDGTHYAYQCLRELSMLYLVEGLR
jgi:hypothetical protein